MELVFAGAAAWSAVDDAKEEVKRIERQIASAQSSISSLEGEVSRAESAVSSLQSEVSNHKTMLAGTQTKVQKVHESITKVLKSLEFHDRDVEFWQVFGKACVHATEWTQRLWGIVEMAAAEEDWKIMRADGTIIIAKSFIEAWEEIYVKQGQIEM